MVNKDVVKLLGKVPLFSGASRAQIEAAGQAFKDVEHDAGDVLAREGQSGVGFFVISEGTADVSVGGRVRASLGPGDLFGEISLLDDGPRTATVTATSAVRALGITAWTFRGLLRDHPGLALSVLEVMAARLRSATDELSA